MQTDAVLAESVKACDIVNIAVMRVVWMQNAALEWLYRVIQEPGRMWQRYLSTNSRFAWLLLKEKFGGGKHA